MRNDREYEICKTIATYLKLQYPNIIYHFDYAGLNLSKAQTGKMKAIQGNKGWPDLFIAEKKGTRFGLFLEIKKEDEVIYLKDGYTPKNEHINNQFNMLVDLEYKGYIADFAIGFDDAKEKIDRYLRLKT